LATINLIAIEENEEQDLALIDTDDTDRKGGPGQFMQEGYRQLYVSIWECQAASGPRKKVSRTG
jgi:hypothetical protein